MDNRFQLLQKNASLLVNLDVLLVNPPLGATEILAAKSTRFFSQDFMVSSQLANTLDTEFGIYPSNQTSTDLAVIFIPRERERRRMLLSAVSQLTAKVWLLGELKGGVKAAAKQAVEFGDVRKIDAARHCGLFELDVNQPALTQLPNNEAAFSFEFMGQSLSVVSYPGVFNHGQLDAGTDLLLQALAELPIAKHLDGKKVLDVGCGAGVLTLALASQGAQVSAVDTNALALKATKASLQNNALAAQVYPSNMLEHVEVASPMDRFDLIVSNPPFHQGVATDIQPVYKLISKAPDILKKNGLLLLVANQFLPYEKWLTEFFPRVEQLSIGAGFKIICAKRD